ncbi:MAG: 23S rRNA (adenine(2503)-C(2))-methyltransferase RlmN [Deltaproteobacteria bacterium]|nr:23S rRNA (adenine(2503)-C(2))-methyltransferase RlmN [Deltaproteobacteria bacterium]
MTQTNHKLNLLDFDLPQLKELIFSWREPAYRADQVWGWLYRKDVPAIEDMTNVSSTFRGFLDVHSFIGRLSVHTSETSLDGTRKFLFLLPDGPGIESVLIPERDHLTLCISTQAGCAQGCRFCLTGKSGLRRNLTAGEIVGQVMAVKRLLEPDQRLTNLVFMGMGEPLANYDQTLTAIRILNDPAGIGFAYRRLTLSTSGLVPQIDQLGQDTKINLAVSLNASDDATRSFLMPINRRYPLKELLAACNRYPLPLSRRITYEYILIKGVNDSPQAAHRLARLLKPATSKINLIPFNPHSGSDLAAPDWETVLTFQDILVKRHYTVIIRKSKGGDISAACGQLQGKIGALETQAGLSGVN